MARLWQSGFELNSTTANVEWTSTIDSPTISSTIVRSGSYSGRINNLTSEQGKLFRYTFASANGNVFFIRFALRIDTRPSTTSQIFQLRTSTNTEEVKISLNTSGQLILADEVGNIGSASSILRLTEWYVIEVEFDKSGSAGAHIVKARLNGTQFAGATNRTLTDGVNQIGLGGNIDDPINTAGDWYFDDVAINDNSGSFQNSYPGDGKIIHLRPNASGDADDWDLTTTYEDIDEVTPDDVTTIITSVTNDQIHDVNVDNTPNLLSSGDTINVVAVGVRFNQSTVAGADPTFVVRIKASASGTVEETSNITASTATWNTNAVAAPRNYPLVLYNLPGASTTSWAKSDLDTTQIGVRQTSTTSDVTQVSTLWASIDYTPIQKAIGVYFPYRSIIR